MLFLEHVPEYLEAICISCLVEGRCLSPLGVNPFPTLQVGSFVHRDITITLKKKGGGREKREREGGRERGRERERERVKEKRERGRERERESEQEEEMGRKERR